MKILFNIKNIYGGYKENILLYIVKYFNYYFSSFISKLYIYAKWKTFTLHIKKVTEKQKPWLHPLHKLDPLKYTQRGKIRKDNDGKFKKGTLMTYRKGIIPQKIQDILIGSLLGDCGGEKGLYAQTPMFHFKQSIIHKNYIFFLYYIFLHWGYINPNSVLVEKKLINKTNLDKPYFYLDFRTLSIPELSWIYDMFYSTGIKIVPKNLINYINGRVLAFWIMDDGSWTGHGILLHTNSFTKDDNLFLIDVLKKKFEINANLRKKNEYYIIYIKAESVNKVRTLTKDFIIKDFQYKIGLSKKE